MGVPEIEKKEDKKKDTPKKKGKKKAKKKSESEEEEEEDEGADYVVEAVLERKVVTGKRGKSHKVGKQLRVTNVKIFWWKLGHIFVYPFNGSTLKRNQILLQTLYLVKWLGWDREEDLTWEPLEHLQDPDGEKC